MSKAAAEKRTRVVTERWLAPKQWFWHEYDDEPDPPIATGPPPEVQENDRLENARIS